MGNLLQTGHAFGTGGAQGALSTSAAKDGRMRRIEPFARIITISRECGAGASRVGARAAAELGFQLWDHEFIAHLARKADVDTDLVRSLDERPRDLIDDVVAGSLHAGRLTGGKYRSLLARAIGELAQRGGAVIVGRGANFLVRADQALRVRLICPLRDRIERYAARERVEWAKAARHVRERDRELARFVTQLSGEREGDPSHYDLLVNTGDLNEAAATRLILSAYEARFGVTREQRSEEPRSLAL